MVYYTIDISTKSHGLTTTVAKFGKFRYNSVPMGLCASSDIFHTKVDNILVEIDGVKIYTKYILVLGKGIIYQHIDQIRVIFDSMSGTGI